MAYNSIEQETKNPAICPTVAQIAMSYLDEHKGPDNKAGEAEIANMSGEEITLEDAVLEL